MLTFKQYIIESTPPGNYVSIDVDKPLPDMKLAQFYPGMSLCDFKDQHVTLIYSKTTDVPTIDITKFLDKQPRQISAKIIGAEAFDAIPKDGKRDENVCTIVLTLSSPELKKIYDGLVGLGLKHSYPEFAPHISLIYGFPRDKKEGCLHRIRSMVKDFGPVSLGGYNNNKIVKNWADKLAK